MSDRSVRTEAIQRDEELSDQAVRHDS
jgi:hypothetical protein